MQRHVTGIRFVRYVHIDLTMSCLVRKEDALHTGFGIVVFVLFNSIAFGSHHQLSFSFLFEQEPLWPGMAVTALVFVLLSGTKKKLPS